MNNIPVFSQLSQIKRVELELRQLAPILAEYQKGNSIKQGMSFGRQELKGSRKYGWS